MRVSGSLKAHWPTFNHEGSVSHNLLALLIEIKILEVASEIGKAYRESLAEEKKRADKANDKKQIERASHSRDRDKFKHLKLELSRLSGGVTDGRHLFYLV